MVREPRQAFRLRRQAHGLQEKRLPHQRAALDDRPAELRLRIRYHTVVGGRCRAEHRHVVRHPLQDVDETSIVRTEIVTPIGDAVHFVHNQQSHPWRNRQQHVRDEFIVRQPLR